MVRPGWTDGRLSGCTDVGVGTGEGVAAVWGGSSLPHTDPGGSANPAPVGRTVPEARICARPTGPGFCSPLSVLSTGAAFGVAHRRAAEPSAGMGVGGGGVWGACRDAVPALGFPRRESFPGRDRKRGGGKKK